MILTTSAGGRTTQRRDAFAVHRTTREKNAKKQKQVRGRNCLYLGRICRGLLPGRAVAQLPVGGSTPCDDAVVRCHDEVRGPAGHRPHVPPAEIHERGGVHLVVTVGLELTPAVHLAVGGRGEGRVAASGHLTRGMDEDCGWGCTTTEPDQHRSVLLSHGKVIPHAPLMWLLTTALAGTVILPVKPSIFFVVCSSCCTCDEGGRRDSLTTLSQDENRIS